MSADDVYFWANWILVVALLVGVAATYAIVVSGNMRDRTLKNELSIQSAATAQANERAASLEKEAAEAKLQYEKLKAAVAWRAVAPDQLPLLAKLLATHVATVQLEYVRGDAESQQFAAQFWTAFRRAGWTVVLKAKTPLGAASGIWVLPNATPGDSTTAAVESVRNAFREIGVPFDASGGPAMEHAPGETWGPNSPPVKVIVGSKPEPIEP